MNILRRIIRKSIKLYNKCAINELPVAEPMVAESMVAKPLIESEEDGYGYAVGWDISPDESTVRFDDTGNRIKAKNGNNSSNNNPKKGRKYLDACERALEANYEYEYPVAAVTLLVPMNSVTNLLLSLRIMSLVIWILLLWYIMCNL